MSSLYALTEELVALDKLLAELGGDVSEGTQGQTLEKWAEEFDWKMKEKVDAYGGLYQSLKADVDAITDEIKRLNDRAMVLENRGARLKALAKYSMDRLQVRKLEGVRFTIAIQKNGGKDPVEVLVQPEDLPDPYRREKIVISPDADAIRAGLEKKDPLLEGKARMGERGESVRIR